MMIFFAEKDKDEMIYDVPKEHILVIDVDMQGTMNLSPLRKRFITEFPKTYNKYIKACINQQYSTGELMFSEENGYKIVLVFTRYIIAGKFKCEQPDIATAFQMGLLSLKNDMPNEKYASSIIERYAGVWPAIMQDIARYQLNWTIYRS